MCEGIFIIYFGITAAQAVHISLIYFLLLDAVGVLNWDVSVSFRGVDKQLTSKIDESFGVELKNGKRKLVEQHGTKDTFLFINTPKDLIRKISLTSIKL